MKTDDLILHLADDPRPSRSVVRGLVAGFLPAVAAALTLLALGWGFRAELGRSLADPVTVLKPILPALVSLAAIAGALRLARPEGQAGGAAALLLVLAGAALGLVGLDLAQTRPEAWGEAVRGRTLLACVLSIPALAILPTLALLLTLRRGASLAPARSGALAGLGGGAAAAALYALHCDEDAPLFFVTWYGLAILATALLGALAGRRLLRW